MFQETEIVTVVLGVASLPVVFFLSRRVRAPRLRFIYAGFALIVCANVAAALEKVVWTSFFTSIGHLCYALASLLFFLYCFSLSKHASSVDGTA